MRIITLINILFAVFLLYSCEAPLNVDAPFRQRYVLNGIMRSDSSIQYVYISRTYRPVNDINPLTDTSDKAVVGAQVNIWYKDTVLTLRDTVAVRTDTSRYKDSVHFYYIKNFKPDPGQNVEIEALLPNGFLLQSNTTLPDVSEGNFFDNSSDRAVPPSNGNDYIYILWQSLGNVSYQPRIMIDYYVKGSSVLHEHEVPLLYSAQNGVSTPIYPLQITQNYITIDMATITAALNEIPLNEQDKISYNISQIDFQLLAYDANLSTYLSSLQNSVNDFTVLVNLPDYSNIQGGYGIFGSFSRKDLYLRFNQKYLNDLGFKLN
jgi:hypothetical protein